MGNPSSVAARRRSPQRRKQFNGRMVKGVFCFVLVVAFADLATALPYRPAPQEGEESNETSEDLQELEVGSLSSRPPASSRLLTGTATWMSKQWRTVFNALWKQTGNMRPRTAPLSTFPTSMRIARMDLSRQLTPKPRLWNASWTLLRCSIKPERFAR